ncbi:MAG: PBP1A family penicillin-binding protein [Pseudophaeobacter sp. bin_em_oilr2.035]|uniref:Penicillin-binding protein 1A n=1 Tax=Phaeobacter gallaeciensis TaxID=60890 RepID=A0ABD4X6N8_9RHOB|nr:MULTISPECIES: PBP1A family penicillin-binding protein [Phaeobacter]MDF1771090.1 PBP1A family penicillin-binding protein [Pseudophaeobacter sp. bin_em_oilr2.035]MDE4061965.1 PBP1A family penicillin-binding protein [Phaeobacter gallaeciensis]MDE4125088.1 PBP1A family penicillin-binding protein [Phaeobacter gallaeciensis]MDE4129560.1 PBP1A family penicillin-binding protein [Phaeobacter gallaeciensis]MDE4143980.1 PBP1A family penicillin-binding protein [Phaeobacter gallaeciensis]
MLRFILSFFGSIFSTITLGVAVVALTIGAVFWMYGRDLPSHESLAQYQPPTISRIYSGEGQLIDEFAEERRLFTPSHEIPALVKQAFISAEDKNFYSHAGYDARGIAAAAIEAVRSRGSNVRGASTITQQVMKNFLLSGDRKAERKIKEIILATRLEETLDKDRILELYLNEIFLGQNSYGVAAASQTYFNKTLGELAPHEAATLASMPKAPSDYHPVRRKDRLLARRNYVLREMYENGYISEDVYKVEVEQPLRSVQNGDFESFRTALPPRDYFTDEIRRQLSQDFGEGEFFTGGFTVRATIDEEMQTEAALAMRKGLEKYDRSRGIWKGTGVTLTEEELASEETWREALGQADVSRDIDLGGKWLPAVVLTVADRSLTVGVEGVAETGSVPRSDIKWMKGNFKDNFTRGDVVLVRAEMKDDAFSHWSLRQVPEVQGGFVAMDVNTGRVLAMQGGFSYQHSVFNRATQAQRQPGSSFKPFVYAAALDSGYSPATIIVDAPIEINTPQGLWRPKNSSNKFYGPTPLRTGIEMSRNLMTIRLAQEVGMPVVAGYAERFGVYDNMGTYLANSLGAEETTLYKMVAAYAMFANGGQRVQPTLVDRIQDRFGKTIYRHDDRDCVDCAVASLEPGRAPRIVADREQVMDPITAYQLTSMMKGVVDRGTASSVINLPVPTAGKTGTTNDSRDVWFVGFTSNIVAGCYMGFDQPRPMGRGAYGGTMCGPVFQQFMTKAVEKFGGGPFEVPEGGHFIKIDRYTGAPLPDDASGAYVVAEYFRDGAEPIFGMTFDGGFAMGSSLPLIEEVEQSGRKVTTSSGGTAVLGPKASFGTISSGGLY